MRIIAYIDGFNLYYRALKENPSAKWLNLKLFMEQFLRPDDTLAAVKYYTASVTGSQDPDAPSRQQVYFRALRSTPEVQIYQGLFQRKKVCRPIVGHIPLVHPRSENGQFFWFKTCEEKGSDVNLASHLLRDAFMNEMDAAFVLSADTDLVEPVRIVSEEVKKPVGIIHPALGREIPPRLRQVASFVRHITLGDLLRAQFPDHIALPKGAGIHRPASWV